MGEGGGELSKLFFAIIMKYACYCFSVHLDEQFDQSALLAISVCIFNR